MLEEEFFLQGDRERAQRLPISPLFDREGQGITKSQVCIKDLHVRCMYDGTHVLVAVVVQAQ